MNQRFIKNVNRSLEAVGKQQGAIVRRFAQQSMRKAPKRGGSQPGQPPRWRTKALRNFILFAWDARTSSVLIGPKKLNKRFDDQPKNLEFGGTGLTFEDPVERTIEIINVRARPYMKPALMRAIRKLPLVFRNAIR